MIEFEQIEKTYQLGEQSYTALHGVSGSIERGEMVALCGPSGSGKSTLLNICGLLDSNYQGSLRIDGKQVPKTKQETAKIRRQQLGFVFQRFNLVPVMTAFENIEYPLVLNQVPAQERQTRVRAMLERVGLSEFSHHRPERLSGGQQQRVAIARALINNPLLVIADEPTASLDSKTANNVIDLMHELGQSLGTTFLVATHDPRMAKRCDRTITLIDGKIVTADNAADLTQDEVMQWAV